MLPTGAPGVTAAPIDESKSPKTKAVCVCGYRYSGKDYFYLLLQEFNAFVRDAEPTMRPTREEDEKMLEKTKGYVILCTGQQRVVTWDNMYFDSDLGLSHHPHDTTFFERAAFGDEVKRETYNRALDRVMGDSTVDPAFDAGWKLLHDVVGAYKDVHESLECDSLEWAVFVMDKLKTTEYWRQALIDTGCDARALDPDVWVKKALAYIEKKHSPDSVPVVTDCRWPNEIKKVMSVYPDTVSVRVFCATVPRVDTESETAMDHALTEYSLIRRHDGLTDDELIAEYFAAFPQYRKCFPSLCDRIDSRFYDAEVSK